MKPVFITLSLLLTCFVIQAQIQFSPVDTAFQVFQKIGYTDIAMDDTGRVWVSFANYYRNRGNKPSTLGLQTIGKDSKWVKVNMPLSGGPETDNIRTLLFHQNALWVGTDKGLYEKKGNQWKKISSDTLETDSVNHFIFKGNNLFMATQHGIKCYYRSRFISFWKHYHTGNSALPTNQIHTIEVDAKGNFWLATAQGVLYFDPKKNEVLKYDSTNSSFPNNFIHHVKVLTNGEVWAATGNYLDSSISVLSFNNNTLAGLFLFKQGRFINVLEALGVCKLPAYPSTTFYRISAKDDKIVFATIISRFGRGFWIWYELNSQEVKQFCLPISFQLNPFELGQQSYLFNNNNYYFYLFRPGTLVSIGFDKLQEDSSFYRYRDTMYRVNDHNIKDVGASLDVNQLAGPFNVKGDMFLSFANLTNYLRVKDQQCKPLLTAAALWIGGYHNGNLHLAASTYRQTGIEYSIGPLKLDPTAKMDTLEKLRFGRIWKVNASQIEAFKKNYQQSQYKIPEPILTWPAHGDSAKGYAANMASFVDVNNNGRYEPILGDYPKIEGQQELYWIFNDSNRIHGDSEGTPLGVEVQTKAYAYVCDQITQQDPNRALNNTIFIRYKIINRSAKTYENFVAGFWASNHLGMAQNDKAGSNPNHQYAYFYQLDTLESGVNGFREDYPAIAIVFLKGFKDDFGKPTGASRMVTYANDFSVMGNPSRPEHNYQYLQGRWKDGVPITYGQNGRIGLDSNNIWMYPGTNDLFGRPNWVDERNSNWSVYPSIILPTERITLSPGEEQEFELALVYSSTKVKQIPALLQSLESDVLKVKSWYANKTFTS